MDKYQPLTEYAPTWKRIDPDNPPRNRKMLFKGDHSAATIGIWYPGCEWTWYCGLPKHSAEDKALIRARDISAQGRFSDGKPFRQED